MQALAPGPLGLRTHPLLTLALILALILMLLMLLMPFLVWVLFSALVLVLRLRQVLALLLVLDLVPGQGCGFPSEATRWVAWLGA